MLFSLIGGLNRNVYLNKYIFDGSVSSIIKRDNIKFTLLDYCIDNKCTKHLNHNFDIGEK